MLHAVGRALLSATRVHETSLAVGSGEVIRAASAVAGNARGRGL
jgi:hypothetical protein